MTSAQEHARGEAPKRPLDGRTLFADFIDDLLDFLWTKDPGYVAATVRTLEAEEGEGAMNIALEAMQRHAGWTDARCDRMRNIIIQARTLAKRNEGAPEMNSIG